jgi:circadian clock protein KaiC
MDRGDDTVSSLMDTWLGLRVVERDGQRKREFFVLKSRGMPHSHHVREVILGDRGIQVMNGDRPRREARLVRVPRGART